MKVRHWLVGRHVVLGSVFLVMLVAAGCSSTADTLAELQNAPRVATATQQALATGTAAAATATLVAQTPTLTPSPTLERLGTVTATPTATATGLPQPQMTRLTATATPTGVSGGGGGGGAVSSTATATPTQVPAAPVVPTATNTPGPTPVPVVPIGSAAQCGNTLQAQIIGTPIFVDTIEYNVREATAVGKYMVVEVDISNISDTTFTRSQPRSFEVYGHADGVAYYFEMDWRASWLATLDTGSDWLGSDLLPGVVNHSIVVFDVNYLLTNWVVIFQSAAFTGADCEARLALPDPIFQ